LSTLNSLFGNSSRLLQSFKEQKTFSYRFASHLQRFLSQR